MHRTAKDLMCHQTILENGFVHANAIETEYETTCFSELCCQVKYASLSTEMI